MGTPLLGVDAFTDVPFRGNPAAVCLLDAPADPEWMQSLAVEMNLSETAFVVPRDGGADGFGLRWFTPGREVELCGHATLASAHALWETGRVAPNDEIRFHTEQRGELVIRRDGERIAMEFPALTAAPCDEPPGLAVALGVTPVAVFRTDLHHFAELESEALLREMRPDLAALRELDVDSVGVTTVADDDGVDFVSRYFAPKWGVPEDPVTGSAHCSIGPWWGERLGKAQLVGYQASRRGGFVGVRLRPGEPTLTLLGDAVTVWRGELEA